MASLIRQNLTHPRSLLITLATLVNWVTMESASAQVPVAPKATGEANIPPRYDFSWAKGITVADEADRFELNVRFRTQNRLTYETRSGRDLAPETVEAVTRRLRLRLEGHALDPRLLYRVQLAFTRADQDWDNSGLANTLRDAVIAWRHSKRLQLLFGQAKLPGNRQRVISSGDQQFVDRSIVNATYNLDRDAGLQLHLAQDLGRLHARLRTAVTNGEGRNGGITLTNNDGLAYTGRLELMPLGEFEGGGDNFEGDLHRESSLKVAIAVTYSHNARTNRTGGQIGRLLYQPRSIDTIYADALVKFRGAAVYAEYAWRDAEGSPVTAAEGQEANPSFVHVGTGWMLQASYLWPRGFEIGGRRASINPRFDIRPLTNAVIDWTGVVTYYLQGHRVKLQTDITFTDESSITPSAARDRWTARFQIELGI